MNFIDVHCHLDGDCYGNMPELMQKILGAGVKKIIAVGYDLSTSVLSKEMAEEYEMCYFAAGFHPTELDKYHVGDLDKIASLARHTKCVAIGEIGLDYHYPGTDKPKQKKFFIEQLKLAHEAGLPVQIHSRDCAEDMLSVLKENSALLGNGVLLHCYSHSTEIALELEKSGVYFGFGGTSTWHGSKKARRTILALRPDRLLTETDSPYLSPQSVYGEFPNTPANIPEILENMAGVRGLSKECMAEQVWQNAHTLFKKLQN